MDEILHMANGDEIPLRLVQALNDLEKEWPGATLVNARPAIVGAILKAQSESKGAAQL